MSKWISARVHKPDYNVSVFVFIPGEDDHMTVGMWDISKTWVLLDEYRKPKQEVTYWREIDFELPEDRTFEPRPDHPEEEDTITYQMRALQKRIHQLETAILNLVDATEDKNGQFRAWHQHLRKTTQEAKLLLNK